MHTAFSNVAAFKSQLDILGLDFIRSTPLDGSTASVLFLGLFHGQTVLWDMTLATLEQPRSTASIDTVAKKSEAIICPFIEIIEGGEGVYLVKVGLDVEIIDESAIKKTIIMMRNYKRLAIGRNEFGSMPT